MERHQLRVWKNGPFQKRRGSEFWKPGNLADFKQRTLGNYRKKNYLEICNLPLDTRTTRISSEKPKSENFYLRWYLTLQVIPSKQVTVMLWYVEVYSDLKAIHSKIFIHPDENFVCSLCRKISERFVILLWRIQVGAETALLLNGLNNVPSTFRTKIS